MTKTEFKNTVKEQVKEAVGEIVELGKKQKELEGRMNDYSDSHFKELSQEIQLKIDEAISNGRKKVAEAGERYKEQLKEDFTMKGEELTDDAKLFSSGILLSDSDINSLSDKYKNNRTMTALISQYAEKNNLHIMKPAKTMAEELELTESLNNYYESAVSRPYFPEWTSDEYFEKAFGED